MILKKIVWYIDHVDEETDSAAEYAEKYVLNVSWSQSWGKMYHEMAREELRHAENFVKMGDEHLAMLENVPEDSTEAWEACKRRHIRRAAEIEVILNT